ncbi:anti-sigma factor [Fodinibius sp. Rm-B-1B1-1]|uniref:anti-sigma factor n=1 Tax=Fodinibius alkaliphilus TaxID=3140241 RepID=UPI003159C54C
MAKQQEDHETFKRLCADYVLNILEQDDRLRFEEMLDEATDEEREIYQQMRTKVNELMFGDTENPSLEGMREQLLAEVEDSDVGEPREEPQDKSEEAMTEQSEELDEDKGTSSAVSMGIIVAVVLGFICLSLIFYSFSLRSEISSQQEVIASQEQAVADLEDEVSELQERLEILDSRQLHSVRMLGMEAAPFAYGNVLWDAQHKNVLVQVDELPTPSTGKQYHLWAIYNNGSTPITTFSVDEEGSALFMARNLAEIDRDTGFSFAVTLEPAGEADQPNGEMYLMGSFGE